MRSAGLETAIAFDRWPFSRLTRLELRQARALNYMAECLKGEHLATSREDQLFHVLTANLETAPGNAGNNFKPGRIVR